MPSSPQAPLGPRPIAAAVAIEAVLGAVALGLGFALGVPAAATLTWSAGAVLQGVVATVPMLVAFVVFMVVDLRPFRIIREMLDFFLGAVFERAGWKDVALVSLAAGIGEELLFRGFLQGALQTYTGAAPALLLAGLAFGLAHAVTAAYAAIATLFGIYLGWLWLATGNLLTVVTTHALYDFIALTAMMRARRRRGAGDDVHRPIAT